jgi:hypothetical protein
MSKVISFRLSKGNPREIQALENLSAWCAEGYSIRHILTEALLKLGDYTPKHTASNLDDLKINLERVSNLLEQLPKNNLTLMKMASGRPGNSELTDNFITSVKKSAKLGMKLDLKILGVTQARRWPS